MSPNPLYGKGLRPVLNCKMCGSPLPKSPGPGRPRKYCDGCRAYPLERPDSSACGCCGTVFPITTKRGPIPSYCSRSCQMADFFRVRRDAARGDCVQCGTKLPAGRRKYCSDGCRPPAYIPKGYPVANCEVCGVEVVSGSSTVPRLCADHRDAADARASKRRRERIAASGEKVDRLVVFERDDWVCQLCDEPVDPELVHPDPWAATVDHVMPLSAGGLESYDNVQLAHRRCNERKSNKILV